MYNGCNSGILVQFAEESVVLGTYIDEWVFLGMNGIVLY